MFWSRIVSTSTCFVVVIAASFSPGMVQGQVHDLEKHLEGVLAEFEEAAGSIEIHLGGVEEIFGKMVDEQAESIEEWGEQYGKQWEKWAERFEKRMERWGARQENVWSKWARDFEKRMESAADQLDDESPDTKAIAKIVRLAIEEAGEMPIGETVERVVEECMEQLEEAPWDSIDGLGERLDEMASAFGEGIEKQIDAIDVDELAEKLERIIGGQLEHLHDRQRHEHEMHEHERREHERHERERHEHEHADHEANHHGHDEHQGKRHRIEIEIEGKDATAIEREILQQLQSAHGDRKAGKADSAKPLTIDRSNPEEVELAKEIQRLQAEKERLMGKNNRLQQLREKVESLRAEVERLRSDNRELEKEFGGDRR